MLPDVIPWERHNITAMLLQSKIWNLKLISGNIKETQTENILQSYWLYFLKTLRLWEFLGGPVVRTGCFHCQGCRIETAEEELKACKPRVAKKWKKKNQNSKHIKIMKEKERLRNCLGLKKRKETWQLIQQVILDCILGEKKKLHYLNKLWTLNKK